MLNISKIAYELYKQDWVNQNIPPEQQFMAVRNYALDFASRVRTECEAEIEMESFEEWLFNNGYMNGSIYVCYAEFCDAEYHDKEYICSLLQNEFLIQLYYSDINNDDGEP